MLDKDGVYDLTVRRAGGEKAVLKDLTMERREYKDQRGQTYTGLGIYFGAEEADFGDRIGYSFRNAADFDDAHAVNLAVMNLLPLPALDGGKLFFLVVDAITLALFGKKIPDKYENYIHIAGLVLLLGFMLLITFSDVWKLFQ